MPSADYYRTQAELLQRWGHLARNPAIAEQLNKRSREMFDLADNRDADERASAEMQNASRPFVD